MSKNVPQIRFEGFTDEWASIQLCEIMNFSNGINAPKENYGQGRKMISVMDILDKAYLKYENIRSSVLVPSNIEENNKVESGDLVFVRSSETQDEVGWAKAYLEKEYALFSGFSIRGKKKSEFDSSFVELSLNYKNRKQIEQKSGGSTRYNVNQEILNTVEIFQSTLKEQREIGQFFKQINDTITLQQQLIEKFKQTKQSMLQKMFPQEGERVPQIRFSRFSGEWKEKKLGDSSNSFSGGTPNVGIKEYYDGDIPFIRSGEINSSSTELFITKIGLEKSSAKLVKKGTLLYAMYGATSGEVGISKIDGAINQAILAIEPIKNYDSDFILQNLKHKKTSILSTYLQGGQGNLSAAIIKNIVILFPPTLEEQREIGQFFKQLDDNIHLHHQKLEKMKNIKQSLLQKMFV